MAKHTLSVHVNLAALTSQLQRALQRSIDLTSFGLMAAARAPREDALKLPGAWFQLATAGNEALDFESARAEFQKWAVACGLRDSIEAMRVFLEEARNIVAVDVSDDGDALLQAGNAELAINLGEAFPGLGP